jgi:hypothetical protein
MFWVGRPPGSPDWWGYQDAGSWPMGPTSGQSGAPTAKERATIPESSFNTATPTWEDPTAERQGLKRYFGPSMGGILNFRLRQPLSI